MQIAECQLRQSFVFHASLARRSFGPERDLRIRRIGPQRDDNCTPTDMRGKRAAFGPSVRCLNTLPLSYVQFPGRPLLKRSVPNGVRKRNVSGIFFGSVISFRPLYVFTRELREDNRLVCKCVIR